VRARGRCTLTRARACAKATINTKWTAGGAPPKQVEVVVRGSQEALDWVTNLKALQVDAPSNIPDEKVGSTRPVGQSGA
jgi:hypothetical protein